MTNSKRLNGIYTDLKTEFKKVKASDAHLDTKFGFLVGLERVTRFVDDLKYDGNSTFQGLYDKLAVESKEAEEAFADPKVSQQYWLKGRRDALVLARKLAFRAAAEQLLESTSPV